ncbi:hypothetical protein ACFY5C_05830 [Streptomyces sp. NPDC012935]|uniref:hypothetical protein n=1 Tax=Streptomyces sp. NPDC012935 TaxID=3364857 RepID=UPI003684A7F5
MLRRIWTTSTPGRRRAVIGASAAVVCLGGALGACGGDGGGDGYVATGAAGGPPRVSGTAAAPTGEVTLVPLDGPKGGEAGQGGDNSGGRGESGSNSPGQGGSQEPTAARGAERRVTESPNHLPGETPGRAVTPTDPTGPPGSSPAPSTPATIPSPAKLTVSDPVREPADKRWCEKVALDFHNSGGTAVRSGTVTFGTHVIGALGIDWATIESTQELPAPIKAGAREEKSWTVCVESWRVPLGMHIETQDVSVRWK